MKKTGCSAMVAATVVGALSHGVLAADGGASKQKTAAPSAEKYQIQRGRYLAKIGGCNDCHTPGYAQSGGTVPEQAWLTGDVLGWRGPWGTTYPANLRIYVQGISEAQWVKTAKTLRTRPPMPWFALNDMTERDLRALYRFIRHLGPAGKPAPSALPPGQDPQTPYIQFPAPPK